MRSALNPLELRRPASVDEALRMMRDEALQPIAGCTDVYVGLNFGTLATQRFIDLDRLDALRTIDASGDTLSIGALATYTSIMEHAAVRERLPMLVSAASQIGGLQIQNRGTLGGNVANGSPAGDALPVLAVAEATIVLRSAEAERRVPFTAFYTGYRASVMRPDELIVALEIPRVHGRQWFRKVGTRAAQAISKLVAAGVRNDAPRIAMGSVAATTVRLPRTEAALATPDGLDAALIALREEISPIDDIRSTGDYRRDVAANLVRRFWTDTA